MRCQRTEKAAAVPQKFTSISFKENFVRNIQIFIQSIFPEMVAFSYIGGTFIVKQCLDIRIQIRCGYPMDIKQLFKTLLTGLLLEF